jgi:hypothetical protein
LGALVSAACQKVTYVESPDDYGEEPAVETRGDLKVCSGCLDIAEP